MAVTVYNLLHKLAKNETPSYWKVGKRGLQYGFIADDFLRTEESYELFGD